MNAIEPSNADIDFMGKVPDGLWRAIFEFTCPLSRKRAVKAIEFLDEPYELDSKLYKSTTERVELADLRRLCKRLQPIVLAVVFNDILLKFDETSLEALYDILSSSNSTMKGAGTHTQRLALMFDTDGTAYNEQLMQVPSYFPNLISLHVLGYVSDGICWPFEPPVTKWLHNLSNIIWECEEATLSEVLQLLRQNQNLKTLWLPLSAGYPTRQELIRL